MAYKQLTEELVVAYMAGLDSMKKIFSSFDDVKVREVGDGNLNYVYIVTNSNNPEETVVLKQAVPFLRVAGESWPLDIERMNFEVAALIGYAVLGVRKPNPFGTILGAIFIGMLMNGLTMLSMQYFWQDFIKGSVLVAALAFTFGLSKKR